MVNDKTHLQRSKVHLTLLVFRGEGQRGGKSHCVLLWMSKLFQNTASHAAQKKLTKHNNQWLPTSYSLPACLPACLSACLPGFVFCQARYIASSLLFRLMQGDKAEILWNGQLRTSRKAVRDIITGLYRIWSKRPNNKATSFPRNNRNSPSSSHHCIPVFMYCSIQSRGTLLKDFWVILMVKHV